MRGVEPCLTTSTRCRLIRRAAGVGCARSDVPMADVLAITDHIKSKHRETPEEQIDRLDETITAIARHLLVAINAIRELRN